MPELLPNSRLKNPIRIVRGPFGLSWVPIYCANCGAPGGLVPEENCDFAFYLCDPCAERLGPIAGTCLVPDQVFWEKVKQVQLERYGRELTAPEIVEALKDGSSPLAKLARERVR